MAGRAETSKIGSGVAPSGMDTGASPSVSWPTGQDELMSMPARGRKAKQEERRLEFATGTGLLAAGVLWT